MARPLVAGRDGDHLTLTGQFGTFDAGQLILVWKTASGDVLDRQTLGSVDPLAAILLDRLARVPNGAADVELRVKADFDGLERLLAASDW